MSAIDCWNWLLNSKVTNKPNPNILSIGFFLDKKRIWSPIIWLRKEILSRLEVFPGCVYPRLHIESWLLTEPNTLIPIQIHKYRDKYIDTETNTYIQNNVTCRPRPSKSLAVCLFVRFGGSRTVAHCSTRIKIITLIKLLQVGSKSFFWSSCCH